MKSKHFLILWAFVLMATFLVAALVPIFWYLKDNVAVNPQFSLLEGAHARLGKGYMAGRIQYSPDGSVLAIPTSIGVWIHDADTLKALDLLTGHIDRVWRMCFNPDGSMLASVEGKTIFLWDFTTGTLKTPLHTLKPVDTYNGIDNIAFSPDGKVLAIGYRKGAVQLWDAKTGRLKTTFQRPQSGEYIGSANIIAFSPDGRTVASISEWQTKLYLWHVETGDHTTHHIGNVPAPHNQSLRFSPGGQTLVRLRSNRITLWDVKTGTLKKTFTGDINHRLDLVWFRPDGRSVVASDWDSSYTYMWDVDTGVQKDITDIEKNIACISPDEETWVLKRKINNKNYIQLWDVAKARPKKTIQWIEGGEPILFSPDGKTLVTGYGYKAVGYKYTMNLWNVENITNIGIEPMTEAYKATLTSDNLGQFALRFSYNKKRLLQIGEANGNLWHTPSRAVVTEFSRYAPNGSNGQINPVFITSDRQAIIRTQEGFGLWDFTKGNYKLIPVNDQRWGSPETLCLSPDEKLLASSWDTNIYLWDVATGTYKMTLTGHERVVISLCFSPDGKTLASGDGRGRALRDPMLHPSGPPKIRFWDVETGEQKASLMGHGGDVYALVFEPYGEYLASGHWQKIRIWDVETRKQLGVIKGYDGQVTSLVFSPDGNYLASGHAGTTFIWRMSPITGRFRIYFLD